MMLIHDKRILEQEEAGRNKKELEEIKKVYTILKEEKKILSDYIQRTNYKAPNYQSNDIDELQKDNRHVKADLRIIIMLINILSDDCTKHHSNQITDLKHLADIMSQINQ